MFTVIMENARGIMPPHHAKSAKSAYMFASLVMGDKKHKVTITDDASGCEVCKADGMGVWMDHIFLAQVQREFKEWYDGEE